MLPFLLMALFFAACTDDPEPDFAGKVIDSDGEPVAGVDVLIAYHLDLLRPAESPSGTSQKQAYPLDQQPGAGEQDPETTRLYLPYPNPSCDGIQTLPFDLADSTVVTVFARSFSGKTDYDHLFMEPYSSGHHEITYQMIPDMYEMNVTFVPDTLVSVVVPELADLAWDREEKLTHCEGRDGFPAEVIDVTDDRGRFAADRSDLIWHHRAFWKTSPDTLRQTREEAPIYRLGTTAAIFARKMDEHEGTPAFKEVELLNDGHFIELTVK